MTTNKNSIESEKAEENKIKQESQKLQIQENQELYEQETKTQNEITVNEIDIDKEQILKQLEAAKNAKDRVELFAKRTDKFWLEAIVWLFEEIWDIAPAVICTCYLLSEWIHVWLSRKDCLKIVWYQAADTVIWAIPIVWDIADFLFQANKYSAEIFKKHLEKIKKAAIEKGATQEEIDAICENEKTFIKTMDKYIDHKAKNWKKKNKK